VSGTLRRGRVLGALGVLLAVGAYSSSCAGDREAGTTRQPTATETTETETTSGESEEPAHGHAFWSLAKLERRLAGETIRVAGRRVRLEAGTLTCGGEGPGRPGAGVRIFAHFSCINPTFPPGQLVGPDALVRVHVTGRTTIRLTGKSFSGYSADDPE
jgi:hypothetical protein